MLMLAMFLEDIRKYNYNQLWMGQREIRNLGWNNFSKDKANNY